MYEQFHIRSLPFFLMSSLLEVLFVFSTDFLAVAIFSSCPSLKIFIWIRCFFIFKYIQIQYLPLWSIFCQKLTFIKIRIYVFDFYRSIQTKSLIPQIIKFTLNYFSELQGVPKNKNFVGQLRYI